MHVHHDNHTYENEMVAKSKKNSRILNLNRFHSTRGNVTLRLINFIWRLDQTERKLAEFVEKIQKKKLNIPGDEYIALY